MKKKKRLIDFFKKKQNRSWKRRKFKKKFLEFLGLKKKRTSKFLKLWSKFIPFQKKKTSKKKKTKTTTILTGLLLVVILFQIFIIFYNLIQLEILENQQKIRLELGNLEQYLLDIEGDVKSNLKRSQWGIVKNQKSLAKKIRHLNYLNAHLGKTIKAYNQDFSLQFFADDNSEKVFREALNIQLISNRIANKVDALLFFERINQKQKQLLEKELELFYEKMQLIRSFSY